MTITAWFSLVVICVLGAMSPGPSLAVVVRNTISGGRSEGIKTALGHGFGVGIYAFATAAGLAVLLIESPWLFTFIQWSGASFLAYLGLRSLLSKQSGEGAEQSQHEPLSHVTGLRSGFFTAFLNPKLAIFFAALFSQFVSIHAGLGEKIIMAVTAAVIDAVWYLFVAVSLSQDKILLRLRKKIDLLNKVFGGILLCLAIRVVSL